MRSLRPSMGQSNLGKSGRNDPKFQAELGPHPNQTSQELNGSFLPLHADSALLALESTQGPCAESAG